MLRVLDEIITDDIDDLGVDVIVDNLDDLLGSNSDGFSLINFLPISVVIVLSDCVDVEGIKVVDLNKFIGASDNEEIGVSDVSDKLLCKSNADVPVVS